MQKTLWRRVLLMFSSLGATFILCGGLVLAFDGSSSARTIRSKTAVTAARAAGNSNVAKTTHLSLMNSALLNIKALCPSSPMKVALLNGVSGNSWKTIEQAEFNAAVKECPQLKGEYFSANGSSSSYNADLADVAAQGVKVIVAFPDFGPASLPAYEHAVRAGSVVVPDNPVQGAKAGSNVTVAGTEPPSTEVHDWLVFLNKAMHGHGNIVYLGGTAGNSVDVSAFAALKSQIKKYPGLHLLGSSFYVTDWEPAQMQQVLSGLLSKYHSIGGVVTTLVAGTSGIVNALKSAGKPLVPVAGLSGDNQDVCLYKQYHKRYPNFQVEVNGGNVNWVLAALQEGLAAAEHKPYAKSPVMSLPVVTDTLTGKYHACDSGLPPGVTFTSLLSRSALKQLFK